MELSGIKIKHMILMYVKKILYGDTECVGKELKLEV
jgi:hypothetical protein